MNAPTSFILNIEAARYAGQQVTAEQLRLSQTLEPERWIAPQSGNRYLRVNADPGRLEISYEASIVTEPLLEPAKSVVEVAVRDIPISATTYLFPSRFCPSDKLKRFAAKTFSSEAPGFHRVAAICSWIHDNVEYVDKSSDVRTSAFTTASRRTGDRSDLAHLAIAICRALDIPARLVSAYAPFYPDFYVAFEAYLTDPSGPGWFLFDPTRTSATNGLVRIGVGHDASEVELAKSFGDAETERPEVWFKADQFSPPSTSTMAVRAEY